jgi:hypothetical protein
MDGKMRCLLAIVLLVTCVSTAQAANAPNARLNAASTEVAGKPATVWCESDEAAWTALLNEFQVIGFTTGEPWGFAVFQTSTAYLHPDVCLTLRAVINAGAPSDWLVHMSWALHAFLHESVHLRGIRDEGITDCIALSLHRRYAVSLLGIPETVTYSWVTYKRRRVKVRGKWRWKRVPVRHKVVVPNPQLDELQQEVEAIHRIAPPPYNRDCARIVP